MCTSSYNISKKILYISLPTLFLYKLYNYGMGYI